MKKVIKSILNWIKEKQYLIYFSIALFILDFYLRYQNRGMKSYSVLYSIPNLFSITWILLFCILLYISSKKLKKIFITLISLTFSILFFVQLVFSRIFSKFFAFNDVIYAGEGSNYFNTIFGYIKLIDIAVIVFVVILIVLSIYSLKFIKSENKKIKVITTSAVCFITIVLFVFVQILIGKPTSTTNWDSFANKRNIYNQFNDTKRSMMLFGLYEYSFRDFYLSFIKKDKVDYKDSIKDINKFISSQDKTTSKYNGIFKDKNLIFIMLEDIDTWMLNEKSMPTLYNLKENSIDFTEHYSATYASGMTFNTEFISNTGLIPNITAMRTSYSYNKNNYDYSLANLFKNKGYIVNSIHKNKGSFYNRDNMHLAWGYQKHFDYATLNTDGKNLDLDTTVVSSNLDKFIYDDKFMTYYITYSAHMPYQYTKPECDENIDEIKKLFDSDNEEYLCAMSQSRDTDNAIKYLIDELKKLDKLKDTVLIFYSDHYAYSMNQEMVEKEKNEFDYNLKTKTPFFIYSNGEYKEKIDKVNSTVDILPTVADLFGLDYNPNIYFGNSIFNDDYKGLVIFNDKSWYDGEIYYKGSNKEFEDQDYVDKINNYVDDLLTIGGKIIETDYFKMYNLNNKKR